MSPVKLPNITFTALEDGAPVVEFGFDQHKITSPQALALRWKVSAAIRMLTLTDEFLKALSEYAVRGAADSIRFEERFKRTNETEGAA